MRHTVYRVLTAIVLLMAISACFLIPSGAMLEEAQARYQNAGSDEEEFVPWDESAARPAGVLASAGASDVLDEAALGSGLFMDGLTPLPIDMSPGRVPPEANFTETGYEDQSLRVTLEQRRMYNSDVFVAYVQIADPSQLRTGLAGKLGSGRTLPAVTMAQSYNAVVAISGDYYNNDQKSGGYIVRQGETWRKKYSDTFDYCIIDENGDLHMVMRGKANQEAEIEALLAEHTVVNALYFGPALIKDGAVQPLPEKFIISTDSGITEPRAAIGQLGPLSYALVVVTGRSDASEGVSLQNLASIMLELGCQQAYNLDGGGSATLAYHGDYYSTKSSNVRSLSDILYFSTAVGE